MPRISERQRQKRRQQIIDAAINCFVRDGFHVTTMQDIGHEAQISASGVYRYFASKEDIIEAAADQRRQQRAARLRAVAKEGVPLKALEGLLQDFLQRLEHPKAGAEMEVRLRPQVWSEALRNARVRDILLRSWADVLDRQAGVVRAAQEAGDVRADLDADAVSLVLLAFIDGLTVHKVVDPGCDVHKAWEVFAAMCRGTFAVSTEEASEQNAGSWSEPS